MSLTGDILPKWHQGIGPVRHNRASLLLTAVTLWKGAVAMQVDGKAQKPVTGTAMAAKCLLAAGADANGGSYMSARQNKVRVKVTSAAAEKIVIARGATIDIDVQYNNGTSTAATIAQLVDGHAVASRLLRWKAQGTGASSPAAMAFTAVPYISLLGATDARYDNGAGVADLALEAPAGFFGVGLYRMTTSDAPALPSICAVSDENTIKQTIDPLDILVPVVIEDGNYFADLAAAF